MRDLGAVASSGFVATGLPLMLPDESVDRAEALAGQHSETSRTDRGVDTPSVGESTAPAAPESLVAGPPSEIRSDSLPPATEVHAPELVGAKLTAPAQQVALPLPQARPPANNGDSTPPADQPGPHSSSHVDATQEVALIPRDASITPTSSTSSSDRKRKDLDDSGDYQPAVTKRQRIESPPSTGGVLGRLISGGLQRLSGFFSRPSQPTAPPISPSPPNLQLEAQSKGIEIIDLTGDSQPSSARYQPPPPLHLPAPHRSHLFAQRVGLYSPSQRRRFSPYVRPSQIGGGHGTERPNGFKTKSRFKMPSVSGSKAILTPAEQPRISAHGLRDDQEKRLVETRPTSSEFPAHDSERLLILGCSSHYNAWSLPANRQLRRLIPRSAKNDPRGSYEAIRTNGLRCGRK